MNLFRYLQYELLFLKTKCENLLLDSITTESVSEILLVADLHQSDGLKRKCANYIRRNRDNVKATEGWQMLEENQPKLAERF